MTVTGPVDIYGVPDKDLRIKDDGLKPNVLSKPNPNPQPMELEELRRRVEFGLKARLYGRQHLKDLKAAGRMHNCTMYLTRPKIPHTKIHDFVQRLDPIQLWYARHSLASENMWLGVTIEDTARENSVCCFFRDPLGEMDYLRFIEGALLPDWDAPALSDFNMRHPKPHGCCYCW
jgi:hypothetical protein